MADKRETLDPPKPWEILGAFFGYFAVAKDAPAVLRQLKIGALIPIECKSRLLQWNGDGDFWFSLFFTLVTLAIVLWWLPRERKKEKEENKDQAKQLAAYLRQSRIIRTVRSFGLVLIREWTLDLLGVGLYGTFKRHSTWSPEPRRLKHVDRITYRSGYGIEMQYGKNFETVFARTHPENDDNYGPTAEMAPTWREVALLLVASNCFPFWFLVFLLKRPLVWMMKVVGLR